MVLNIIGLGLADEKDITVKWVHLFGARIRGLQSSWGGEAVCDTSRKCRMLLIIEKRWYLPANCAGAWRRCGRRSAST